MSQANPAPGWYPDPSQPGMLREWDGRAWTVNTQAAITGQQDMEIGAGPARYSGPPILVVTTNDLPGYKITAVLGEVFGTTVRARNAFSNMGASFRTMFGGEAKAYSQLLTDSRLEAVDRLRFAALQMGANAVLMMRFDSGDIANLMNEVTAYGTAVTVEPLSAA
ncbi:MAG: heavy metal-binding domain-containing protein [Candidatus Nanopelagicales bacterium]